LDKPRVLISIFRTFLKISELSIDYLMS
jgi:hypothetical protein